MQFDVEEVSRDSFPSRSPSGGGLRRAIGGVQSISSVAVDVEKRLHVLVPAPSAWQGHCGDHGAKGPREVGVYYLPTDGVDVLAYVRDIMTCDPGEIICRPSEQFQQRWLDKRTRTLNSDRPTRLVLG